MSYYGYYILLKFIKLLDRKSCMYVAKCKKKKYPAGAFFSLRRFQNIFVFYKYVVIYKYVIL